jgi:hypothetical protein
MEDTTPWHLQSLVVVLNILHNKTYFVGRNKYDIYPHTQSFTPSHPPKITQQDWRSSLYKIHNDLKTHMTELINFVQKITDMCYGLLS